MRPSYNSCFVQGNNSCLPSLTHVVKLRLMSLGARIKEVRESLGWQQEDLAAKVPGLTQPALSALEVRDSKSSQFAFQIAEALGVSARWLMTGAGRKDDVDWPFPRVRRERWDLCNDVDRGYVQAAINKALDECEAQRPAAIDEKHVVAA